MHPSNELSPVAPESLRPARSVPAGTALAPIELPRRPRRVPEARPSVPLRADRRVGTRGSRRGRSPEAEPCRLPPGSRIIAREDAARTEIAPAPDRDPARWARFVALVVDAGIGEERLLAAFPDPEDVEDILLTPDAALGTCARTVAASLGAPSAAAAEATRPVDEPAPTVRCGNCAHFERAATHPRLGRCGAGERATAAAGWWDTQPRACASFAPKG